LIDTYTPGNYQQLNDNDADLGSAAPVMLPKQNNSKTPYLTVQAGKDQVLRLLNRQNLSGMSGPNYVGGELQVIKLPNACSVVSHPVAWNDTNNITWIFVANDCGFSAFRVITGSDGASRLALAYKNDTGGSSPLIANNILFLQTSGEIRAIVPTTGAVLWSSTQGSAGGSSGTMHWQSPIVVNGCVYATDEEQHMLAYGLP
jgi:hypothetical protein